MTDHAPTLSLTEWRIDESRRPIHDALSPYVERCWLPLLGPSTLLFLRFAVRMLDGSPDGVTVDEREVATALGLGGRSGDGAPFRRVLARAEDFRIVRTISPGSLAIRRHVRELSPRQLERSPRFVRASHDALRVGATPTSPTTEHALRLAYALAGLGESPAEIERQLRHWQFSPATASRSARATAFGGRSRHLVGLDGESGASDEPRSSPTPVVAAG